jgi:hypothetical protein
MVGAERSPALDDEQREVRTVPEDSVGDQAVGKPTTDQNQFSLHEPSGTALAMDGTRNGSANAIPGIGLGEKRNVGFTIISSSATVATLRWGSKNRASN